MTDGTVVWMPKKQERKIILHILIHMQFVLRGLKKIPNINSPQMQFLKQLCLAEHKSEEKSGKLTDYRSEESTNILTRFDIAIVKT